MYAKHELLNREYMSRTTKKGFAHEPKEKVNSAYIYQKAPPAPGGYPLIPFPGPYPGPGEDPCPL